MNEQEFWNSFQTSLDSPECRVWTRGKSVGYGEAKLFGKQKRTHVWVWTLLKGNIPKGLCVLHRCDNRLCGNIEHLFLGTRKDNALDRDNKGRGKIVPLAGERNGQHKLTRSQVDEIRAKYRPYFCTLSTLAKEYGVRESTIQNVVYGRNWN